MSRSRIAENTIFLTVSGAASAAITLVQLAVLSRYLSGDSFGLFVTLRGFSLLLGTAILVGLPQVLVRFLPTHEARNEAGRSIGMFFLSAAVVTLLGCALCASSGLWERLLPSGVSTLIGSHRLIIWLALSSVTLALKMLLYGGFSGLREMRMQMLIEVTSLAIFTAFMIVERVRLDVEMLFAAMFVINLAAFVAGIPVFVRQARRHAGAGSTGGTGVVTPNFFSYWTGAVCLSVVALAFTDFDRFVMSSVLPMAAISLFHVASRVDALLKRFLGLPILAAQPEITRVYEEGRWTDIAGRIGLFTKGMVAAALFSTALFAVIGRDAIVVLSGHAYADSYRILLILLPTVPLAAISAPLMATMRSLHYMKWAVLCDFLWMAVYFGSFFLLVSTLGVEGMAIAQVLASLVQVSAAVLLARREGFFGGIGGAGVGRLAAVLVVLAAAGMAITLRFHLPASIAAVLLAPPAAKLIIGRLRLFNADEKTQVLDLVKFRTGRKVAAWMLSTEER